MKKIQVTRYDDIPVDLWIEPTNTYYDKHLDQTLIECHCNICTKCWVNVEGAIRCLYAGPFIGYINVATPNKESDNNAD